MAGRSQFYEMYRSTSIGSALLDALDELIQDGEITGQLALKILAQAVATTLEASQVRVTCKGSLKVYNNVEEVWTFILNDASVRNDGGDDIKAIPKLKIVACKGAGAQDTTRGGKGSKKKKSAD